MAIDNPQLAALRERVTFFASFDRTLHADLSRGEPGITLNPHVAAWVPKGGRYGGCLRFTARDHGWVEDECVFAARDNFPYQTADFEGTISLWIQGDPDRDLDPAFPVDPFHISRHPADGSFYLDLTRPGDERYGGPRKLRFGIYGDSPAQDKLYGGQLVVIGDLGWHDGDWHHVVATWKHANSGAPNGEARVYLDGRLRGYLDGYAHQLTWDINQLRMGLGQRFVGGIDELLILDQAVTPDEVADLTALPSSLREAWNI